MTTSLFNVKYKASRTGATMVECAVALPVVFFILFGLLDLGLAAARYNSLSEAARRIAREAAVHGSLAGKKTSIWGPQEYQGTAADSSDIANSAKNILIAMPKDDVAIHVRWLDSDNSPQDRVQVELSYRHKPVIPALCVWGELNLHAASTMRIVN